MNEFEKLFYDKLNLSSLSEAMQQYFLKLMNIYLKHGRSYEYVAANLDKLIDFFEGIGIGRVECAIILMNDFSLINSINELYDKYLFLGILENEDNTFRKHKFFSKTKDYRVSLNTMYARYKLCLEAGYGDINWNIIVHSTDNEFVKRFITSTYRKPYQIFESPEQVSNWLASVDMSDFDIEEFKSLAVNEEIVEKYEVQRRKR